MFSSPNDIVLDPYMGGGTTIVEAMVSGRIAIGCDVNSLAVFVTKAKTALLTRKESDAIEGWADAAAASISYRENIDDLQEACPIRSRNMHMPRARAIKKYLVQALNLCTMLPTRKSEEFARCVLLNVGQWALNGRRESTTLDSFRDRIVKTTSEMLVASVVLSRTMTEASSAVLRPRLIHGSAEDLSAAIPFSKGSFADLVVTSPPYPGIHVLYHRWQVDGRRETPVPYWIANCLDGAGSSFYNFGPRKELSHDSYFEMSRRTLAGIRNVMRKNGVMVQMLAFSNPRSQLPRYLMNMEAVGFREVRLPMRAHRRIWRDVPGRSWHASLKGATTSSREVVLIHEAV
jgi:hypothetical protein